jgi:CRP-like cAMP-binding protein
MFVMPQTLFSNKFLDSLAARDSTLLLPYLKPVSLSERGNIYEEGEAIEHVYFPLNCVVSSVVILHDGATVEVSMTGRESAVGIVSIFGEYKARNWTRVLIPGDALKMKSETLRQLCHQHETLQTELMHCYRRIITQVSQRAVCSCRHTITQRLCCWLLMVHDRVGADEFALTHDLIAGRLGTRRAGITQVANMLQSSKAIRYHRGRISIIDRSIIERAACECYATYKDEFYWFEDCAENERQEISAGR